jgi:hypothetical protein
MPIDHVILVVDDLEAASRQFMDDHGLASYPGGRHVGMGTANVIVPLGPNYIELLAVVDPEEATTNPNGRAMLSLTEAGGGLVGWMVRSDDLDKDAARLGLTVISMSRRRLDGVVLDWRLGLGDVVARDPSLPSFIQWNVPEDLYPGAEVVAHRVQPSGIAWLEVTGDAALINAWVGSPDFDLRIEPGEPGVRRVGLAVDGGEIVLG